MTDGCRHPAHLTVSPFADCQLEPTVGYALAEADRRIAGPENGIGNAFDLGRPGKAVFQTNASPQRMQACLCGVAFDLYEIGFGHLEPGISDPRLQPAVVGEQKEAFAIQIEPSRRIEIGRALCRAGVCRYVQISVVAVSLKKKRPT